MQGDNNYHVYLNSKPHSILRRKDQMVLAKSKGVWYQKNLHAVLKRNGLFVFALIETMLIIFT